MKKLLLALFLSFCALAYFGNAPTATAGTIINDDYYGYNDHDTYGDVIGDPAKFGISQMEVSYDGFNLTVDVQSRYLNNIGALGTALTDMFVSTDGWHPNTDLANYLNDSYRNGEDWEYALVLDAHDGSKTSGELFLYGVPTTGSDHILLSDNVFGPGGTYRNDQEVLFDTGGQNSLATGGWSIILGDSGDMDDIIRFSVGYDFGTPNLAFHYASATCANEVIEGAIPEPTTILLSGLGLLGMGAYLRRRRTHKS